jgi:hypothetical protein
LRKSLMAAGAATLALGVAGVAYAQVAPVVTATAKLSPTKAGTKSKPKNVKFTLGVTNNKESNTTAKSIAITFPSTLKLSTKGLPACTKSDDTIITSGPKAACKSSIAGTGTASAVAGGATINFAVTPLVGKNQLLFYLAATGGITNKYVVHGKISGKKLTITIPGNVQQPIAGLYSALTGLNTTLSMKKGSNYLISSTGCSGGADKIGVTIAYAPNPNPPVQPSGSASASAKCSK